MRGRRASGGGEAPATARGATRGVLVEGAVLHDAEDALGILEDGDVGHGVAVHEEQIGEEALLDLAQLRRPAA